MSSLGHTLDVGTATFSSAITVGSIVYYSAVSTPVWRVVTDNRTLESIGFYAKCFVVLSCTLSSGTTYTDVVVGRSGSWAEYGAAVNIGTIYYVGTGGAPTTTAPTTGPVIPVFVKRDSSLSQCVFGGMFTQNTLLRAYQVDADSDSPSAEVNISDVDLLDDGIVNINASVAGATDANDRVIFKISAVYKYATRAFYGSYVAESYDDSGPGWNADAGTFTLSGVGTTVQTVASYAGCTISFQTNVAAGTRFYSDTGGDIAITYASFQTMS
jgi:hypothetical protein